MCRKVSRKLRSLFETWRTDVGGGKEKQINYFDKLLMAGSYLRSLEKWLISFFYTLHDNKIYIIRSLVKELSEALHRKIEIEF